MEELESQIAKIQLGNPKHATSFVFVMAEKASGSDAELYMVAELPVLNPAALDSCEKISLAIASTLKRAYKKPLGDATFENATSQINEELGKLASLGQTHWINKLNCIIGVKNGSAFTIATCGKVSAYLFRNSEFTDISCSTSTSHPLKTFENYATGKIRLNDLVILSTNQLFNYISLDRLKNILSSPRFLGAAQTIIELLKENAGPEVAFGTILNLQVPQGQAQEEDVDLEEYIVEKKTSGAGLFNQALSYAKAAFALDKAKRIPKTGLPSVSLEQKIKNFGSRAKNAILKSQDRLNSLPRITTSFLQHFKIEKLKQMPKQKKIFFASVLLLLLAFAANIVIASRFRHSQELQKNFTAKLKQAEEALGKVQSSLLYEDSPAARNYLETALSSLPKETDGFNEENQALYSKISGQISEVRDKVEKPLKAEISVAAGFGQEGPLLRLPQHLSIQVNGNLISYNKDSGALEDNFLKFEGKALAVQYAEKNLALVYTGSSLVPWNFAGSSQGSGFGQSVPPEESFAGISYYPVNKRVYLADKSAGRIISFLTAANAVSRPSVAVSNESLKEAMDIAIDGSIYALVPKGILKFQSGNPAPFSMPLLLEPFSGKGKIRTERDFENIYLLDAGSGRIIIMDKKGGLVGIIRDEKFTRLSDFQVDEKTGTIYALNDGTLLKIIFKAK